MPPASPVPERCVCEPGGRGGPASAAVRGLRLPGRPACCVDSFSGAWWGYFPSVSSFVCGCSWVCVDHRVPVVF